MTLFLLIFFLLLAVYGFLIDRYRRSWNALPEHVPEAPADVFVSVIVAVRNEAHNIENLLQCLYDQDYPRDRYEVLIVDDHSTDGTAGKLNEFLLRMAGLSASLPAAAVKNLNLRLVTLPAGAGSKKSAIAAGVDRASGTLIATTDADCMLPVTWLSALASFYESSGAGCIAGPVLMRNNGTWLGVFQCLDFLSLQGITGAALNKGMHVMGNGANLAYPRETFIKLNGFERIDTIPSGDDMLLMQKISMSDQGKISYLKSRAAVVSTAPEKGWGDFFNQRIRWASKSLHYQDKRIFYVLLITYLCNLCFMGLLVASFIQPGWWPFFFLCCIAKLVVEYPFVNAVAIYFRQQQLMKYFVLLQPVHILYTIIAGWLGSFGSYRWKGRTIKNSTRIKPAKP